MYDIIIIGAGCAGMTAAVYATRAGKSVMIIENESIGGQISYSPLVENFPGFDKISGMEFSDKLWRQCEALGVTLNFTTAKKVIDLGDVKKVVTDDGEEECRAVIIATGVKHRHLGIEREDALVGKGVSYCALCDGAFYKNKTVAVAGGGNTALQNAVYLAGLCEKVYLIHRRDQYRADKALVDKLEKLPNVIPVLNANITALLGEDSLNAVEVTDKNTGDKKEIGLDGLFVSVGHIPENSAYADVVDLDESGYIISDESCVTKTSGIFAAGDCRTKEVRQLTTAAADGAVSATAACNYIG